MKIVAKLLPNNKFQIKRYRLAEGHLRSKKSDDSAEARQSEYEAVKLAEAENIGRVLQSLSNKRTKPLAVPEIKQLGLFGVQSDRVLSEKTLEIPFTELPGKIEVAIANPVTQEVTVERTNYWEEVVRRKVALDLLKKSQQTVKKPRPWGRIQSPKVFRYQAGQKIKEGGAIIDRFCGAVNSSMLTLTLPGGTVQAMDALGRWSGYIINRLTQVIRRVDKTAPPVYWFFVWEHQKRGALHLHWCIGWSVHQEFRERLCEFIAAKWWQCLQEIGKKEKIDMFARKGFQGSWRNKPEKWQYDIQQVQKSVAAYFAKYCQKNRSYNGKSKLSPSEQSKQLRFGASKNHTRSYKTYPSRYWGSSRTVKKWCAYLSKSREFADDCQFRARKMLARSRALLARVQRFRSINYNEFECTDEKSGICFASGEVWTFTLFPEDFPEFWLCCMDTIMEREVCMDAMLKQLISSA